MSVKIMSAIFETEFFDLPMPEPDKEGKPRRAKGSSLKLVLLALADHANDEGESSYPGLTKLQRKTALSRQGLVDVLSSIMFNGLAFVSEEPSKLGTNDYTINLQAFPVLQGEKEGKLLVKSLDYPASDLTSSSKATLPEVVKSLDLKHPLTTNKPSHKTDDKKGEYNVIGEANKTMDAILKAEGISEGIKYCTDFFESALGFGSLPWGSNAAWRKFQRWVAGMSDDLGIFKDYETWRKGEGKYQAMSNNKIRQNPQMFMDTGWPTFLAHTSMYGRKSEPQYKPFPKDENNYVSNPLPRPKISIT